MTTMSLYTSLFFLYRYGAHRDLHSFPTRRSSDLVLAGNQSFVEQLFQLRLNFGRIDRREVILHLFPHEHPVRADIDRKSTRLNSSHTVISYAVFCLKKKNETPTN